MIYLNNILGGDMKANIALIVLCLVVLTTVSLVARYSIKAHTNYQYNEAILNNN